MKKLELDELETVCGGFRRSPLPGRPDWLLDDPLPDLELPGVLTVRDFTGGIDAGWVPDNIVQAEQSPKPERPSHPVITPPEFRGESWDIREFLQQNFEEQCLQPRHNSFRSRFLRR